MTLDLPDAIARWAGEKLSYVFLVSVAVMAYEVIARYLFDAPTIWAHETTICLTAIGFVFGGAFAIERSAHIRITIVYQHCPPRLRYLFDIAASLVTATYLGLMVYAAWILAARSWAVMETSASAWNQPTPVLLKTVLVAGALLMTLQALARLIGLFARGAGRAE